MNPRDHGVRAELERAAAEQGSRRYVLRLYVSGITPRSTAAIRNIRRICEDHLRGRYELEVIDIYRQPVLAEGEQILAAPTLIKQLPLPLRRFIGDMSDTQRILVGMDLRPGDAAPPPAPQNRETPP